MYLLIFVIGVVILAVGVFCLNGFEPETRLQRDIAEVYGMIFVMTGTGLAMIGLLGMLP